MIAKNPNKAQSDVAKAKIKLKNQELNFKHSLSNQDLIKIEEIWLEGFRKIETRKDGEKKRKNLKGQL